MVPPDHPQPAPAAQVTNDADDLQQYGYKQRLERSISRFGSFAVAFSMMSITTAGFALFAAPFQLVGGVGVWLWVAVTVGLLPIVLVYAHLSARIPITGYAYQWSGRLVNRDFGWFVGWTALVAFFAGTASVAVALATVFAPYIWANPTPLNVQLLAAGSIVAAALINVVGIRFAARVNNIGASIELFGTLLLTIVLAVALFFATNKAGPSILFQVHASDGSPFSLVALGLAALLPITTMVGWEGAADLAEETVDPRRNTPRAMIRSVLLTGVVGLFIYAVFSMAIPNGVDDMLNQSGNPMLYVFQAHLGSGLGQVLKVVVFIAIFACLLANLVVATRMLFSLSRDNMLPFSRALAYVSPKAQVPVWSIMVVTVISVGFCFMSSGLFAKIGAIVGVTYYATYLLTLVAVLFAAKLNRMPSAPGYFDLGRWLKPLAIIGIAWALLIIVIETVPEVNRDAGLYTLAAEAIGVVWYLLYVRRHIRSESAGDAMLQSPLNSKGFLA